MDYLKKVLHIDVKIAEESVERQLPNYLASRYGIQRAYLDALEVFLVFPNTELEQASTLRKHIEKIQSLKNIPAVLILRQISARQRQTLIDMGLPFVVESKQCYLPFLGTVLTEKCNDLGAAKEQLIPSAQMLLLYYLQCNQQDLYTNTAVEALGVSAMTITRAVRQLEQLGLINTRKNGVRKIMTSAYPRRELFERARAHLTSPVKKTVYIPKACADGLLIAGDQALSMHSMLNPPRIHCYATGKWEKESQPILTDETQQAELQIWKYDPDVLSDSGSVDILSLSLCYLDDRDERIEEMIEQMLNEYWEDTDGKRI